jgi:hypothetical protein
MLLYLLQRYINQGHKALDFRYTGQDRQLVKLVVIAVVL